MYNSTFLNKTKQFRRKIVFKNSDELNYRDDYRNRILQKVHLST